MKTGQAIEQMIAAIMTNTLKSRRAYGSAPTRRGGPGALRRPRRRPAVWLLAGALLIVPIIALTWNDQRAKAQPTGTTFVVNQPGDAGDGVCDATCTLREAIAAANAAEGADTISFDSAAFAAPGPHIINLSGALPDLSSDMTIQGPGANILTVRRDKGGDYRIFTITAGQTVTISGLTISNGAALLGLDPHNSGGGILNQGTLSFTNSTVSGNSAHACGGGICNWGSATANVINSTVTRNYSDNRGGGIGNRGTLTVQNTTVSDNSSLFYGGGIWNYWSNTAVSLTNSTVSGNHTGDPNGGYSAGGGIFSEGRLTLTNCTVSGNSSDEDGGGIADEGTLTVISATMTNNRADADNNKTGTGGGIFFQYDFPLLRNTIVAGNYRGATSTTDDDIVRGAWGELDSSSSFNLIGTGGSGGLTDGVNGNQVGVASPGLGPLQNNGGPTETHALLAGSPVTDKGHNFGLTTDQRGFPRPYDDPAITNASGGDGSDIGAFEVQAPAPTPAPDADNDGVPDGQDNCPTTPNPDQADNDNDWQGDACDPDDDNDGQTDVDETACGSNPLSAASRAPDNDSDNSPDCLDPDDDNDSLLDTNDNCQFVANPDQANSDGDALGNACDPDDDNDGIVDGSDNCPLNANANQADNDGDGQGDICDSDDDNDGVADLNDNCQFAPNADQANNDGDSLGNVCDPDDDNDGIVDGSDNCPLNANTNQADSDADGLGDACDADDDNDGVADARDNCPLTANPNQFDRDNDGQGDICDPDDDNDGVADTVDNCPLTPNFNQADADGDGVGDVCDRDNASSFVVNSTNDPGTGSTQTYVGILGACDATECTLREAIAAANADGGVETITFDIPGAGPHTIQLGSVLPDVSESVNILNTSGENIAVRGEGFADAYRIFWIHPAAVVTISGLTITNGAAIRVGESLGGGIYNRGTLTLINSTVSGNFSGFVGGGIYNSGSLTLINSTVSGNTASANVTGMPFAFGGGIHHGGDTLSLFSTTITNNRVDPTTWGSAAGGGTYIGTGTWRLYNSIIADNYKGRGNSTEVGGGDFNLIGTVTGTSASAALINGVNNNQVGVANPGLGPLADNGGPTQTHGLQTDSPAIDKGRNLNPISFTSLTTDQRGSARPYDDPSVADAFNGSDIGAFERQPGEAVTLLGTNVAVQLGPVSVMFSGVSVAGTTTQVSINPATAGTLPGQGQYTLGPGLPAYWITTTAQYTPPVTVCIQVPSVTDPVTFAALRILHGEEGGLVDRTILPPGSPAPDFAIKTLCARVNSLSPFVVAQQVVYNFNGFFRPIESLPLLNVATAGSAMPVKFSLSGNQGLAIFATGYPASSPIPCDATEPGRVIEETVTAGSSSLSYDAASDRYNYVWKTERSWRGTCRMLIVRFNDNTEHYVKFRFR